MSEVSFYIHILKIKETDDFSSCIFYMKENTLMN